MRYFDDGEPMPGSDRTRDRNAPGFPLVLADQMRMEERRFFPFQSWAASQGFQYPDAALPILRACGSAAEAFFVREFVARVGVTFHNGRACCGPDELCVQTRAANYRIDVVVCRGSCRLAIEVDGMAFHHRTAQQVAADYLRQRRITCAGFTVIRFTAPEVFANPKECWRQVDLILEANA